MLCMLCLGSIDLYPQATEVIKITDIPEGIRAINCIEVENDSIVWIGTNKGLIKIQGTNLQVFFDDKSMSKFKVNTIFIDNDGTKWLGNYSSSVVKFKGNISDEVISFMKLTDMNQVLITNIVIKNEKLWASTSEGNILYYNTENKDMKKYSSPDQTNVYTFAPDFGGTNWLATPIGIFSADDNKNWKAEKKISQGLGLFSNGTDLYAIGRNDDSESVLLKLQKSKGKWKSLELNGLPDKYIKFNDMDFDSAGNCWIATNYGIIKYDIKQNYCYTINPHNTSDLEMREVRRIAVQNNRFIWIASLGRELFVIKL